GRRHREVENDALVGPVDLSDSIRGEVMSDDSSGVPTVLGSAGEDLVGTDLHHLTGENARTHDANKNRNRRTRVPEHLVGYRHRSTDLLVFVLFVFPCVSFVKTVAKRRRQGHPLSV